MGEVRYELHPGDGLFPATVLELSDVPQTLFVRGDRRCSRRRRSRLSVRARRLPTVLPSRSLQPRLPWKRG